MEATFADWTERFKVYNEYIKTLGEYKLQVARAELVRAETEDKLATVRAKKIVIRQIERDLRAFNRSRAVNTRARNRIRDKARESQLLLRGSRIASSSFNRGWSAYVFFESKALIQTGDRLFRIRVSRTARRSSNFVSVRAGRTVDDAPDEVENVLQLMQWLKQKRYIAAGGSRAQLAVVKLYQAINSVATNSLEEIQARLAAIRAETYNAWNFNAIVGVSENSAAKKIEEAGAT